MLFLIWLIVHAGFESFEEVDSLCELRCRFKYLEVHQASYRTFVLDEFTLRFSFYGISARCEQALWIFALHSICLDHHHCHLMELVSLFIWHITSKPAKSLISRMQ